MIFERFSHTFIALTHIRSLACSVVHKKKMIREEKKDRTKAPIENENHVHIWKNDLSDHYIEFINVNNAMFRRV